MNIAVLSGKGGAGKTLAAVSLAVIAAEAGVDQVVRYVDCDAEAPNGGLFLGGADGEAEADEVVVPVPAFEGACPPGCRACADFCAFGALASVGDRPLLFEEMCHGCGGCARVCEAGVIVEGSRRVGQVEKSSRGRLEVLTGRLDVGESSSMPVIDALLACAGMGLNVLDCPPGTACPAAECVRAADFCVVVAEPTEYGVHNMEMALDLVEFFRKPAGVLVNREVGRTSAVDDACARRGVELLGRIPFDLALARRLAHGEVVVEDHAEVRACFEDVLRAVRKGARP